MAKTMYPERGGAQMDSAQEQQDFRFSLNLRVDDPGALWMAAAQACLDIHGLSMEELEDVIGPAEDPAIGDCLMLLALPSRIPGCTRLDTELQPLAVAHLPRPACQQLPAAHD